MMSSELASASRRWRVGKLARFAESHPRRKNKDAPRVGHAAFVLSHPFRKEREMDGAPEELVSQQLRELAFASRRWQVGKLARFAVFQPKSPQRRKSVVGVTMAQKQRRTEGGTRGDCAIPPISQRTRNGWGTRGVSKSATSRVSLRLREDGGLARFAVFQPKSPQRRKSVVGATMAQKERPTEGGTRSVCAIPPISQRARNGWGTRGVSKSATSRVSLRFAEMAGWQVGESASQRMIFGMISGKKEERADEAHKSKVVKRRQMDGIVVGRGVPDGRVAGGGRRAGDEHNDRSRDRVPGERTARHRNTGGELAIVYDGERPTSDCRQYDGGDCAGRICERESGRERWCDSSGVVLHGGLLHERRLDKHTILGGACGSAS